MAAKAVFINQLASAYGRRAAQPPVWDKSTGKDQGLHNGCAVPQQPHVNQCLPLFWGRYGYKYR